MRKRGKTDKNHSQIVRELRQAGATVLDMSCLGHGCPDILVGWRGKNLAFEIKDGNQPPSKQRLTEDEHAWHQMWQGQVHVIESFEHAMRIMQKAI